MGAKMFGELASKAVKQTSLKRKLWVVSRGNSIDMDKFGTFLVSPGQVLA